MQETSLEKDLGVVISDDGKTLNQCQYAYNKAIRILGMINRTIRYKERRIMVRLYKSLVRPHLEYCVSTLSPHYLKDKELLERVQHRFTRMFKDLRQRNYGELEIRSMERGICPIAMLALHLTLNSLTGSRV